MTPVDLQTLVQELERQRELDLEKLRRGRRRDARWYLCRLHQLLEELDFALIERRPAERMAREIAAAALRLAELQAAEMAPLAASGGATGPERRSPWLWIQRLWKRAPVCPTSAP